VRTVGVLHKVRLIKTKQSDFKHYEEISQRGCRASILSADTCCAATDGPGPVSFASEGKRQRLLALPFFNREIEPLQSGDGTANRHFSVGSKHPSRRLKSLLRHPK